MSLKAEIQTWAQALEYYDAQDFENALAKFETIADSSKILFNIGLIYATLSEHEAAVDNFHAATNLDQYLAVAYFQCGVSNFLLGRYEEAVKDFEDAFLYLRGNLTIDYDQLGLKFRLYSCEVLFNKGLALVYMGRESEGSNDINDARKEKQTAEHGVIDEAYQDRGDGYTVFSIPVGVLYRPPANKLKNLKTKNYLGQAKLVAATDATETFVGFTGAERALRRGDTVRKPSAPTSRGAGVDASDLALIGDIGRAPPLVRRGTAAARMEHTNSVSTQADLRRRPTENTVAITPPAQTTTTTTSPPLQRSATTVGTGRSLPQRKQSLRRQILADDQSNYAPTQSGAQDVNDLLDSYSIDEPAVPPVPPLPRGQPSDRVADWARQNALGSTLSRGNSSGSGERRSPVVPQMQRSGTLRTAYGAAGPAEYGYAETVNSSAEMQMLKVRVKLHHAADVRGMSIDPSMPLAEFTAKVVKKFQLQSAVRVAMRYKDEEGSMVTILDEDDWESAVDTARAYARGRPEGKVEVWVEDR